jgi:hypothetical protein
VQLHRIRPLIPDINNIISIHFNTAAAFRAAIILAHFKAAKSALKQGVSVYRSRLFFRCPQLLPLMFRDDCRTIRYRMSYMAGVRSPTKARDFSSNLCVQTGSVARPASCTVGTGGSFPGVKKRPTRDADHLSPSSAEVKRSRSCNSSHPKRLHGVQPDHFTFFTLPVVLWLRKILRLGCLQANLVLLHLVLCCGLQFMCWSEGGASCLYKLSLTTGFLRRMAHPPSL